MNAADSYDGEIDLRELFLVLISGKWVIVSTSTIFLIIGIIFSLSLPNVYESKALLVSSSSVNNSGSLQGYSGLASFAGIDISQNSETNSAQAIEKLKSLSFFENYFLPNIFLPNLMGLDSWNSELNLLEYDNKIYNIDAENWTLKKLPSAQKSYDIFMGKHLSINVDNQTNFISITVKHQSPYIAQKWTQLLIDQINIFYRTKDKNEAERASNYLNSVLAETKLSEIKQEIAKLLQKEIQKLTLIQAKEFYVFEFINPPVAMEKHAEPSRSLICILAAFLGGLIGVLVVFIRHYLFAKKL